MSSAKLVYIALQTFNRPATRAEIQTECGLDRHGVHAGLRRLRELGAIVETGPGERFRGLYALVPDVVIRWPDRRKREHKDIVLEEVLHHLSATMDLLADVIRKNWPK